MSDELLNDIKAGKPVDLQAALRVEKAKREKLDNDAVVMQFLVARMEKAIGSRVDQKILIGALITILAKTISHSPITNWEKILFDFMQATAGVLESVRLQFEAARKAQGKTPATSPLAKTEEPAKTPEGNDNAPSR